MLWLFNCRTHINMQLKTSVSAFKRVYLIKIAEQVTQYVAVCNKWAMLSDKKVESRKWTAASGNAKGLHCNEGFVKTMCWFLTLHKT